MKKSDVFGELEKYLKLIMHSHFKPFIVKNQRTYVYFLYRISITLFNNDFGSLIKLGDS